MNTITETHEVTAAFEKFEPGNDGAFATCRLIDGADSAMDPQEWAELGTIDGVPAQVYWIFAGEDAAHEEADFMPFDVDHVYRIELAEMDADGDFESL